MQFPSTTNTLRLIFIFFRQQPIYSTPLLKDQDFIFLRYIGSPTAQGIVGWHTIWLKVTEVQSCYSL